MERRCWNGCDAEPWKVGNVFCKECFDRVVAMGSSKRPSARAEPQPRTWSYEDIRAAFERDREEL